ncbi:MAG: zinc metallopeptidase [Bacteroidales bacterium]|nr:zinc metallopeptidase [Bacteroidales bacterium]
MNGIVISPGYLIIFLVFLVLSLIVGGQLKSRFKRYSKIATANGMSGKEVAEKMLHDHGIYDVRVVSVAGTLSDHYNPRNKTVNLSKDVYSGRSVAAAAVAAHECGHAIQHANAYSWLEFRSAMVPVQNISSTIINVIFIGMFIFAGALPAFMNWDTALAIIIACYGIFTLFAFVTLPVEINASQRALVWIKNAGVTDSRTHSQSKDALRWAAYTYVVAALSALATLLYFIMLFMGSRD